MNNSNFLLTKISPETCMICGEPAENYCHYECAAWYNEERQHRNFSAGYCALCTLPCLKDFLIHRACMITYWAEYQKLQLEGIKEMEQRLQDKLDREKEK